MKYKATEENVKISGRTIFREGIRYLSYSASSIEFAFTGKKADIAIWTDGDKWDETLKGWVAVFINGAKEPSMRFRLQEPEGVYTVYEGDSGEPVNVKLVKYSEAAFGKCGIQYIEITDGQLLPPSEHKSRKIEIIGDSITCGYGNEAKNELETFDTTKENPIKAYSTIVARNLDAEVNLVSWSGIGIISRYVPEEENEPLDDWLMPMLYQYTDASCSKEVFKETEDQWEKWDYQKFVPDCILINIGTNDASYCREHEDRKKVFARKYKRFIQYVREYNPQAEILCMLGTMDQRLCGIEQQTVLEYSKEAKDDRIHFLHLPMQEDEDGKGADYHPSLITHKKAADIVTAKVREIMNWN